MELLALMLAIDRRDWPINDGTYYQRSIDNMHNMHSCDSIEEHRTFSEFLCLLHKNIALFVKFE